MHDFKLTFIQDAAVNRLEDPTTSFALILKEAATGIILIAAAVLIDPSETAETQATQLENPPEFYYFDLERDKPGVSSQTPRSKASLWIAHPTESASRSVNTAIGLTLGLCRLCGPVPAIAITTDTAVRVADIITEARDRLFMTQSMTTNLGNGDVITTASAKSFLRYPPRHLFCRTMQGNCRNAIYRS